MQEKTIGELNKKVWYRLLKVVYLAFFVTLLVFGFMVIWSKPRTPLSSADFNTLRSRGFSVEQIVSFGEMSDQQLGQVLKSAFPEYKGFSDEQIGQKLFQKYPNLKNSKNKKLIETAEIIAVFIIAFELIRRIFYYVVLGKFRPKKN